MAFIVATDTNAQILLNDNDRLYIHKDVEVVVDVALPAVVSASGANGHEVAVDGTVVAMGGNAIVLEQATNGFGANTLVIGETGVVRTLNITTNSALFMLGSASVLQNFGEVTGTWGAFQQDYDNGLVENHGIMSGTVQAGLFLINSENVRVFNTGLLTGSNGIETQNSSMSLLNSGSIIANALGEAAIFTPGVGPIFIENTGRIQSLTTAIETDLGADVVKNSGVIDGNVLLGADADVFNGIGGTVFGTVFGEAGDDLYIIDDPLISLVEAQGEGTDEVVSAASYVLGNHFENLTLIGSADIDGGGNGLDNVMEGNDADNTLVGRDGNDTLSGNGGDDLLDGGAGNDRAFGGDGNDFLRGRLNNDVLVGDDGDDRLQGDLGNDRLFGSDGEDLLIGGEGQDDLFGGRAMDIFRFRTVAEVGAGAARDVIGDFEQGTDLIDLFQIDADVTQSGGQAFTLIAGAFTGTAGELRAFNGGGNTFIDGDVDGDGALDFRLELTGVFALNGGDFLL